MKALSFRQPWGFAVTHLGKRIENRVWTWLKHGYKRFVEAEHLHAGEVFAIHASATKPEPYDFEGVETAAGVAFEMLPAEASIRGKLIGVATVIDVLRSDGKIVDGTAEKKFPHYVMREDDRQRYLAGSGPKLLDQLMRWWLGPYALVLDNVRILPTPLEAKGALGFWTMPPELEKSVTDQLGDLRSHLVGDPQMPPGTVELRSGDKRQQMTLFSDPPAKKERGGLH